MLLSGVLMSKNLIFDKNAPWWIQARIALKAVFTFEISLKELSLDVCFTSNKTPLLQNTQLCPCYILTWSFTCIYCEAYTHIGLLVGDQSVYNVDERRASYQFSCFDSSSRFCITNRMSCSLRKSGNLAVLPNSVYIQFNSIQFYFKTNRQTAVSEQIGEYVCKSAISNIVSYDG